jgi:tyrosine-specific transport protein
MNSKLIGGILMILGTSVGAGMLALPVVSAQEGFLMGSLVLVICWLAMTLGAFLMLEVCLWLPTNSNLISMSKLTLGKWGQALAWITYLFLLYSLLCAYIAGSSDILRELLANIHIRSPQSVCTILVTLILGSIVYRGISSIDMVNRGLMSIKLLAYIIIVLAVAPHIHIKLLLESKLNLRLNAIMVTITSFGFAIIVPSLIGYYDRNVTQLKRVILIGSIIPLIIYILWIAIIHGLLPKEGPSGLLAIANSNHTTSLLMQNISLNLHNPWLAKIASLFISICAVTSFLGVSLCLTDFIADGLKLKKTQKEGLVVFALAFIPPLLIVFFAPGIFVKALSYAGIFCVILLILLPVLMAYSGRYCKKIKSQYQAPLNKWILVAGLLFSAILITWCFV